MKSSPPPRWGRWGVRAKLLAWKNTLTFYQHGRARSCRSGTKLAIFKPDRLGDFVLALGAIRWLVREKGESECVLFVSPHGSALAEREFPAVPRVVIPAFADELRPAWRAFQSQATEGWWQHSFEMAISLRHQRTPWQELLFGRLRCTQRWALENEVMGIHPVERRWIATKLSHPVPFPKATVGYGCRELEAHHHLLQSAFGARLAVSDAVPQLAPPKDIRSNGSLLLCPFGSAALRTLPVPVVAQGVKGLGSEIPLRLAAPPAERARYEAYADELVAGGLPRPQVVLTPTMDSLLWELAASRMVLSTESAPAHLAVALDRPAVILLGGGHHGLFAPWSRSGRQVWLDHRLDCYHCDWQCCHPEPYCLTRIAPPSVTQALLQVANAA